MNKIPIIIDTDIGDDIDDTWALVLALSMKELDIKLISVSVHDTLYKAKLVAKILTIAERTDIPIAIGKATGTSRPAQQRFVEGFDLLSYQGVIYEDALLAYKKVLSQFDHPIDVIGIGPMTTLADIARKSPVTTSKMRLTLMAGALYKGYINQKAPDVEYNVIADIEAFKTSLSLYKNITVAPLDVCRDVILKGKLYQTLKEHQHLPLIKALFDNQAIWYEDYHGGAIKYDSLKESTILYDWIPFFYLMNPNGFKQRIVTIDIDEKGKMMEGKDYAINALLQFKKRHMFYKEAVSAMVNQR